MELFTVFDIYLIGNVMTDLSESSVFSYFIIPFGLFKITRLYRNVVKIIGFHSSFTI